MTRWAFIALLSHWRRAPVQLFAIVIGLALSAALWSAVQAINATARATYAEAQDQLEIFGADRILAQDGSLTVDDYVALRRAGWLVSPVWDEKITLGSTDIRLMAIDMVSHPLVPLLVGGTSADAGQTGATPILSDLPLFGASSTLNQLSGTFETAAVPQLPDGLIVTDLSVAQRFSDTNTLSYLVVLENNTLLASQLPGGFRWLSGARTSPGQLTDSFHLNLTAFGLLAFVVGLFIVQSTIKLAVEQRRPLMRTLRSLGLSSAQLISLCAIELTCLALVAGSLGLLLGYFIAGALLPGVSATLQGLYGAEVNGGLRMELSWVLLGLSMTLLGTAIAGGSSLFQVYRLPILQGPAISARGQASARGRLYGIIAGGILLAFTPLLLQIPHLIAGFALMGALMLGSVLLMPSLLAAVIFWAERLARPGRGEWIWSDMRMQLGSLNVPLMALALAIATNIGVETMTSSFRLAFVGWINQRFAADLYVDTEGQRSPAEIIAYLQEHGHTPRPLMAADLPNAGHPTRLLGVINDPYYANHWPMVAKTATTWPQLHANNGIVINEQMARSRNLWPGDTFSLPAVGDAKILGVYPDYGNPNHQIVMSAEILEQISPNALISNIAVSTHDKLGVRASLQKEFNIPTTSILDQAELRDQSLRIFDQTFVVTAALNVLTLAVASFALLTSFAALWNQRLPQIAPIWAIGLPTAELAKLEIIRSLGLALLTALLAIPLGLVLAWVLLSVTNVLAFGWKLPLFLFPTSWLRTVLLALMAALLACLPSALRLARTAPTELLKVFSSER